MSVREAIKSGGFWLDIHSGTRDELNMLADIFGIHNLTLEDIATGEEREKCEFYEGYTFLSLRALCAHATYEVEKWEK